MAPRAKNSSSGLKAPVLVAGAEFRGEVGEVVGRLGGAISTAIAALPPEPAKQAADVRRALDLDTKLASQIFRVSRAPAGEGAAAAVHIPGPPSMRRFVLAIRRHKVDRAVVRDVTQAYAEFLQLVDRVAGDRVTFDSMAADLAGEEGDEQGGFLSVEHRRRAFRAMSHLSGVQVDTLYRCAVLHRSAAGPYDFAQLRLFRQVRRLSARAGITLYRNRTGRQSGAPLAEAFTREPIDGALPHVGGTNMFPAFSSDPLPEVRASQSGRGAYHIDLVGTDLGNSGAVDCAFGHVDRRVVDDIVVGGANVSGVSAAAATTGIFFPTKRLVCDLLVPAGLFEPGVVSTTIYSNVYEMELNDQSEWRTLPQLAKPELLAGTEDVADAEHPGYAMFVRTALRKLGWEGTRFEARRLIVEYPVLFSSVQLSMLRTAT